MAKDANSTVDVATVENTGGSGPFVLVCEHASHFIPPQFARLGVDEAASLSHVAWDPGAAETARHMSRQLDAPLVVSNVSRLVYDCNRPPEAPDAMPARSEIHDIPGNRDLTQAERDQRTAEFYRPFESLVERTITGRPVPPVLVTMHSFTPVYFGRQRATEIGILHDEDSRFADAMLAVAGGFRIERNEPYGPKDGVTHTLKRHGLANGLMNVMIEVRNDLVASPQACEAMAAHLSGWIKAAAAMVDGGARERLKA